MSVEQAISIAVIGVASIHIWARWMRSAGDEWRITEWVRRHWQCATGGRGWGSGWQKCGKFKKFKA